MRTGGLRAAGLLPDMGAAQGGNWFGFGKAAAGALILRGARVRAGGLRAAELLPGVVQSGKLLRFGVDTAGTGTYNRAGSCTGGLCALRGAQIVTQNRERFRRCFAASGAGFSNSAGDGTSSGNAAGFRPDMSHAKGRDRIRLRLGTAGAGGENGAGSSTGSRSTAGFPVIVAQGSNPRIIQHDSLGTMKTTIRLA